MARRSDHSREELHALIMESARKLAEEDGLGGLTARRIASRIGYAPGTIYNLFSNLDDLVLQLRGETLDSFYEFLSARMTKGPAEEVLVNIAQSYIEFVSKHSQLWAILFEHRLPEGYQVPDWYHARATRLLGLVEQAIAEFFEPEQSHQRLHHAQVLWASLHGICSIQLAGKLVLKQSTDLMARSLISNYVAGLRRELGEAGAG